MNVWIVGSMKEYVGGWLGRKMGRRLNGGKKDGWDRGK